MRIITAPSPKSDALSRWKALHFGIEHLYNDFDGFDSRDSMNRFWAVYHMTDDATAEEVDAVFGNGFSRKGISCDECGNRVDALAEFVIGNYFPSPHEPSTVVSLRLCWNCVDKAREIDLKSQRKQHGCAGENRNGQEIGMSEIDRQIEEMRLAVAKTGLFRIELDSGRTIVVNPGINTDYELLVGIANYGNTYCAVIGRASDEEPGDFAPEWTGDDRDTAEEALWEAIETLQYNLSRDLTLVSRIMRLRPKAKEHAREE